MKFTLQALAEFDNKQYSSAEQFDTETLSEEELAQVKKCGSLGKRLAFLIKTVFFTERLTPEQRKEESGDK